MLSRSLSHTGHWKFNMASHGKELSEDLKKWIVALHKDGVGYKKIVKTLKLRCSTVAKTIQRFNRTGSTQNRPHHGRPKKLSVRAQHHIQRFCLGNRRMSSASIAAEFEGVGGGQYVSIQPLLGLFHNGLNVIVPLQVLRNCGAQESEWLHCSHGAIHDGEWGRAGGSPEVQDHLHCFEHVKLQVVKNAPDSQLLNFLSVSRLVTSWMRPISVVSSANFRSLTEGSLDVQSLVYREKTSGEFCLLDGC